MNMLRCFIAIELPSLIQSAIGESTAALKAGVGADHVRWVPIGNMHLTLKFLGDTAPSGLEMIGEVMATEAQRFQTFEVGLDGFGVFPNSRQPRVLWIGLTAPPVLASLQRELDAATGRLGYPSEMRSFSPHLTIGRVRQNVPSSGVQMLREELERYKVGRLGSFGVDSIHLFKSELMPSGSRYAKLLSAPLAGR